MGDDGVGEARDGIQAGGVHDTLLHGDQGHGSELLQWQVGLGLGPRDTARQQAARARATSQAGAAQAGALILQKLKKPGYMTIASWRFAFDLFHEVPGIKISTCMNQYASIGAANESRELQENPLIIMQSNSRTATSLASYRLSRSRIPKPKRESHTSGASHTPSSRAVASSLLSIRVRS